MRIDRHPDTRRRPAGRATPSGGAARRVVIPEQLRQAAALEAGQELAPVLVAAFSSWHEAHQLTAAAVRRSDAVVDHAAGAAFELIA